MKISIKTLQQTSFVIDANPEDTVASAKSRLVEGGHAPDAGRIKLIHAGRIMVNEKTVGEYGVKDGDHMVMMVTQPPSQIKPTSVPAPNTPKETKAAESAGEPLKREAPASADNTSEKFRKSVRAITEMGYLDTPLVEKAVLLSNGDPDRAVELLESGDIFDMVAVEETAKGADENAPNPFEYLRSDPQFRQMRAIIQSNPQLLPHLVEQLRQSNPEIFELVSSNSSAFVQLMQEGLDEQGDDDDDDNDGGAEGAAPRPGASNIIRVTDDERAAIERLEQMGFDKAAAVEAFFACDKNEELAANFLLEHMQDDN